jgi:hypothetical protein
LRIAVDRCVANRSLDWRKTHPDPVEAPDFADRRRNFERQPRPVGGRTAIGISPLIRAVTQKLIEQEAVRHVYLDAVESSIHRLAGDVAILVDHAGQLVQAQRPRHRWRDWPCLADDHASCFMDGVRHEAPRGHLGAGEDAWRPRIAVTLQRYVGRFGNDKGQQRPAGRNIGRQAACGRRPTRHATS